MLLLAVFTTDSPVRVPSSPALSSMIVFCSISCSSSSLNTPSYRNNPAALFTPSFSTYLNVLTVEATTLASLQDVGKRNALKENA